MIAKNIFTTWNFFCWNKLSFFVKKTLEFDLVVIHDLPVQE
jgi:hypothetical protein